VVIECSEKVGTNSWNGTSPEIPFPTGENAPMAQHLFEDLAHVLRQEMGCYEKLLNLLRREKAFLLAGHREALAEQVKQKETLGLEVKVLEEARLGLMRKIGVYLGIEDGELTCSALAQLAPPSNAPFYEALLVRFEQLIGEVAEVNKQNGMLLEGSLQYTRSLLTLFTTLAYGDRPYGEDDRIEGGR
ncbi:MAG: flagellar protein FlgN, partial [Candidatus Methylomirabilales bacterium]